MLASYQTQQSDQRRALNLFWQAIFRGQLRRLWAWLTRQNSQLRDLQATLQETSLENSHYTGLKTVELNCIRGTEGKADAFDAEFHPLRDQSRFRWMEIALANMRGKELPPVDLVKVDDLYYVRDGHHRISVARSLGQQFIDAEVTTIQLRQRIL